VVIAETDSLPLGWEVNAICRLFVLDQIRGEYLTFQGRFSDTSINKICAFFFSSRKPNREKVTIGVFPILDPNRRSRMGN
jgi:hypothetical protein